MKIEITRSFSKKIQLKQYEPIEFFCSAKSEVELLDFKGSKDEKYESIHPLMKQMSKSLDAFVQWEVEKSANKFRVVDSRKIKDTSKDEAENDVGLIEDV